MSALSTLLVETTIAGAAIPLGGLLASWEHIRPRWLEREMRHGVVAFGGGALLAAVALVLVPHGLEMVSAGEAAAAFLLGGLACWWLQGLLDRSRSHASQLVAMLADFVPEVIALGALLASGGGTVLMTVLIALQNLPEGFNAYRELRGQTEGSSPSPSGEIAGEPSEGAMSAESSTPRDGLSRSRVLLAFVAIAACGPALGAIGYWGLADRPQVLGWMQLIAAGGIVYLVFEDIAPEAKLENSRRPALGAVLGFLVGVVGKALE